MKTIESADLTAILAAHCGNREFAECLQRITRAEELMSVLGNYIHFNSIFGSGVANLAGEIGARRDLFRDPDDAVEITADRSVEVAAEIFYAAIDEFGSRHTSHRSTHRSLAQATLKAAADFLGYGPTQLNELARPCDGTLWAVRKVSDGYGLNQKLDVQKIFRAIGFHMGSEVLADEEFNILDRYLREQQPDLVAHLKSTKVQIGGTDQPAYHWIQIHTSVEADHFDAALIGAQRALEFYAGTETRAHVKSWIIEGFKEFTAMQEEFIGSLIQVSGSSQNVRMSA
jgi:hypothetical protein